MTPRSTPNSLALLPHRGVWFWRLPLLAITAIIAVVALSVWIGLAQEHQERRAALVSDALWMEQNLRYQFENAENHLAQIGNQFGLGGELHSDEAQEQVRQLLQGNSGFVALLWLNSEGQMLATLPASAAPVRLSSDHPIGVLRARTLNRPAYSHPFTLADGTWAIEVVLPIFGANDFNGYAVGIFSLPRLLSLHVPWWFAERYQLTFTDSAGHALASTTRSDQAGSGETFSVNLDRMGGLGIQIMVYRATTRLMPTLVAVVLLIFVLVIAWSLWMLRRQVLRLQTTESALRSEHAFRLAMENSTLIGLRARDLEGRITYVNAAFCRLVGWPAAELTGMRAPMCFWPEGESEQPAGERTTATGEAVETRFRRSDGSLIDVLIYEAPLIDARGERAGWMDSVLDITERKRAAALAREQEAQLEATARLVTMGEMASTLAHELNQPLSAMASYSAGCLNALKAGRFDERQFTDVLGKINHQAQRAGKIVHRIYGFVRRSESRRERLDVNAAVLEATGLLEAEVVRRKVRLQIILGSNLPPIIGDRVLIEQVMVNLLRNGMDAMKDTPEPERVLTVSSSLHEDCVRLNVRDCGCGIPEENAERLFDSFFTTKPEGMGMGLKICRSVAEQHNGRLWFEAHPEGGTVFCLQLPLGGEPDEIA